MTKYEQRCLIIGFILGTLLTIGLIQLIEVIR